MSDVDVALPQRYGSVVAFGDSITDGFVGTTPLSVPADRHVADENVRYTDFLQKNLVAAGIPLSIVHAGITSNRLVTSSEPLPFGPSGVARFSRDALNQSAVVGVLIQEGINDLGFPPFTTSEQLTAGLRNVVRQAKDAGLYVWIGTLLPASNAVVNGTHIAPNSERSRQRVNAWIRSQHIADGVVDFDAALRARDRRSILRPDLASPDRLHPNAAGYKAMADAVDLATLAVALPRCR